MAKKEKEKVAEQAPEKPQVDEKVEKLKVKKPKMKKFKTPSDNIAKVDLKELAKKAEDVVKIKEEQKPIEEIKVPEEVKEENKKPVEKTEQVEQPILEEVTEEAKEQPTNPTVPTKQQIETKPEYPENIQKLVNFMDETGGDINDYVKLNKDYSDMDNLTLLKEYYKTTKPHLSSEEVDFLMEDRFSYDDEVDEDKDIKRKKLALKEQVASAKSHLDGLKSKYYEDIKAGSKLTQDQQKAIDFFNRYNEESKATEQAQQKAKDKFLNKTNEVFNDEFKGFEYKVGEKTYRFNVKDPNQTKESQSDINNFVKKFLNKESQMEDAKGYHKSLFTAMNADAIANHFYEQGKADALKDSVAKSKNIDMSPRQSHEDIVGNSSFKVRAIEDGSRTNSTFKFRKRK
tara:strand:- start:4349 stop:5548 length:1200 start_codon:yes stop_codon:yes gene_type:complete